MKVEFTQDRFLIAILGAIAVLVVAALVIFSIRKGQETYLNQDSPASVVHDYILALQDGDYQQAYTYLADASYKPDHLYFQQTLSNDQYSISTSQTQVGNEQIEGDQALVSVFLTQGSGGLFSQPYKNTQTASLIRQNGTWKITSAPYPYWGYDWYQAPGLILKPQMPAVPVLTPTD